MAALLTSTPHADGFMMPAEWAAQAGCWMAWPERPDNWRRQAAPAQAAFANVANTIAEYEAVTMCVSKAQAAAARALLNAAVRVVEIPTNDAWLRDVGPTFVRTSEGALRAVDWIFNAWGGAEGGLYFPWDDDDRVASKIAELLGVDCYRAPFVLEGGAIHVDGEGTCLTTEQCLLNSNRNPQLTRAQIEAGLRAYLGVEKIVWLGEGVYLDETDGHIDNLCCFLRPGVVALTWCEDPTDPQHAISKDALARLACSTDARGRAFEVVKIPGPTTPLTITAAESAGVTPRDGVRARVAGTRLAASYVNFLIVNNALIVPAFGDPADAVAREILGGQFPTRQVRQVPGREILLGGGNIHCITQQQPRARHSL